MLLPNREPLWKSEVSVENTLVEREERRMAIVLSSQNDKLRITRCRFCVFFGKNSSFSTEKAYSD